MKFYLLFFIVFICITAGVHAQVGWFELRQEGETIFYSTDLYDENNITVVGSEGLILHSADGGTTWTSRPSGFTDNLRRIRYFSPTLGVILGNSGYALTSTDGGTSWQPLDVGETRTLYDIHFFDETHWMITGQSGLITITTDAGSTWERSSTGNNNFNEVAFRGDFGVIVGNVGTIRVTENGGERWRDRGGVTNVMYHSVSIGDDSTAVAVGVNGVIVRTEDKGRTWKKIDASIPISMLQLTGVRHLTRDIVIICGYSGIILESTDAGLTWYPQESNAHVNLEALSFYDHKIGFAAGGSGTVLRTNTGGTLSTRPLPLHENHLLIGDTWPHPLSRAGDAGMTVHLAQSGWTRLRVQDILGRDIAVPYDGYLEAGSHALRWNPSALPRGVYMYHLELNGQIRMRSFVVAD